MPKLPMLIVTVLMVNFTLGVLCLAAARGEKSRMLSVRYYGWGLLAYATGLLIALLAPILTPPLSAALGICIVAIAPISMIEGVLNNSRRRLNRRWVGALLAATVLTALINNGIGPHLRILNLIGPLPIAILLFAQGGLASWRHPVKPAHAASRLLGSILLFCAGLWAIYLGILLTAPSLPTTQAVDPNHTQFVVDLIAIAQILVSMIGMLCLFWIEVLKMEERLSTMAYGDSLTGLPNRRATMMRFEEMASAARRSEHHFSLLLFDIDFFKRVNDTYGHLAGDEVLKQTAALLSAAKRQEDLLGRVGGEEFVLLLADIGLEEALIIAERMRELVAAASLEHEGKHISITISGGLAQFPQDGDGWDRMFNAADRRLYRAKTEGRDRIAVAAA